jgi:2',3'-cyclic-nucleotide 2'-phosphodiesterase (5'-nucleotidase family)
MGKVIVILVVLAVLGITALFFTSRTGVKVGNVVISAGADRKTVEDLTTSFLEDIRFKDFKKAASYHDAEDQKKVDLPYLIERIFQIKPEFLDITRYEVTGVEIDSTGTRARVKTRQIVKILNTGEVREPEIIFYFHKGADGKWYMKLESSLR